MSEEDKKNFSSVTHYTQVDVQPGGMNIQHVENLYQADVLKALGIELEVKKSGEIIEQQPDRQEHAEAVASEDLCHFIFPGLADKESQDVHRQIKDLVGGKFGMKDICTFLKDLAKQHKILLPQNPQNAFDELHRMGMPPADTKGFGYDNFCKYYR